MAFLLNQATDLAQKFGITSSTRQFKNPAADHDDFTSGLSLTEVIHNKVSEDPKNKIVLLGSFMPHAPLEFGGTQQVVREFYPGSEEPAVQVLGPRESDVTIKGRFKLKRLHEKNLKAAALDYQKALDILRIRGNLLQISLGESWTRYGFLQETAFKLHRLNEIEYELKFLIVGFNIPKGYLIAVSDSDPTALSKKLASIAKALKESTTRPTTIPKTIADDIDSILSSVSGVVGSVTGFVDGIVGDLEQMERSANRALGMIRYARSYIAKTIRSMGSIYTRLSSLSISGATPAQIAAANIRNIRYTNQMKGQLFTLAAYLAAMQAKFEAIAKKVPLRRHVVKKGDTLQTISMKYFSHADAWEDIYKFNKLTTTVLTIGSVLEIPRL